MSKYVIFRFNVHKLNPEPEVFQARFDNGNTQWTQRGRYATQFTTREDATKMMNAIADGGHYYTVTSANNLVLA
ncbi:MAG TPA: hypothetical protein VGG86_20885 [Roseiarcus sp.]